MAAAGSADAALVQITQDILYSGGNWVWDTSNNSSGWIHGDVTGDGVNEFALYVDIVLGESAYLVDFPGNQIYACAWGSSSNKYTWVRDVSDNVDNAHGTNEAAALIDMTCVDARINGGATTHGQIEVHAWALAPGAFYNYAVEIERFVFDDADPAGALVPSSIGASADTYAEWVVPEPATMGLLGLGGVALLRRKRRA